LAVAAVLLGLAEMLIQEVLAAVAMGTILAMVDNLAQRIKDMQVPMDKALLTTEVEAVVVQEPHQ
jgi:hypothetical protein